jgi:hypothetical protein
METNVNSGWSPTDVSSPSVPVGTPVDDPWFTPAPAVDPALSVTEAAARHTKAQHQAFSDANADHGPKSDESGKHAMPLPQTDQKEWGPDADKKRVAGGQFVDGGCPVIDSAALTGNG